MLVDKEIRNYGDSLIRPFSEENLGCVSYDLTIEGFVENDILKPTATLLPNRMAMVKVAESLTMPNNLVATIGGKNSRIRQGLNVLAPIIFPGHKTAIYLGVYNCSTYTITLSKGEKIAQIFFDKLNQEPETPYSENKKASYNNETGYRGFGKYDIEYKKEMKEGEH